MAKGFFLKMAQNNLSRNKQMYVPYFVAAAIMTAMYFIILNIVFSKSISNISYGGTVQAMFSFGIAVMTLFTVGYMLYINSFLIKRRKKEFGLYGILGLEKRHVAKVILWENFIISIFSLLIGLLSGAVLGKFIMELMLLVFKSAPNSRYLISPAAILVTVLIFGGIFVLTSIYNLFQVRLANPIDLLKGEKKGEKRLRFVIPLTIIGLFLLLTAYVEAIFVDSRSMAILLFWPAVILVIIATWMLFASGSNFFLTKLKNNKKFYYKANNFIAISGLLHRLKQNAAGLSNICILSTMVMVTVACCTALYFGQENILNQQNPDDVEINLYDINEDNRENATSYVIEKAKSLVEYHQLKLENIVYYNYAEEDIAYVDGKILLKDQNGTFPFETDETVNNVEYYDDIYNVLIITAEQYNRVTGESQQLAEDQIIILSNSDLVFPDQFSTVDGRLNVKSIINDTPFTKGNNALIDNQVAMVVANNKAAEQLRNFLNPTLMIDGNSFEAKTKIIINVDGEEEECLSFTQELYEDMSSSDNTIISAVSDGYSYSEIFSSRADGYGLFGGFLFLGAFFAVLFLTNTVLIIYFKQISEGYDDRERFEILQKVGMDNLEVKRTINKQILIVFFLPLFVALLHIAAASNMIVKMLEAFMLYDIGLTLLCIFFTVLVFSVVYIVVFRITAKTYYNLVKW